ncbi:MAG TPA: hypothetical protein VM290_00605 [Gaiellaceae bacterium]|nr:hypothetical protein [Gaiellaceae bacterium]
MSEHDLDEQVDDRGEDEDAGFVGGGGPPGTMPDRPGPGEEDLHRPDTDHGEL